MVALHFQTKRLKKDQPQETLMGCAGLLNMKFEVIEHPPSLCVCVCVCAYLRVYTHTHTYTCSMLPDHGHSRTEGLVRPHDNIRKDGINTRIIYTLHEVSYMED